jgi:hypothetical protein
LLIPPSNYKRKYTSKFSTSKPTSKNTASSVSENRIEQNLVSQSFINSRNSVSDIINNGFNGTYACITYLYNIYNNVNKLLQMKIIQMYIIYQMIYKTTNTNHVVSTILLNSFLML